MTYKCFWHGVLIAILSVALATPARADTLKQNADNIVIGTVAAIAAVVVLAVVIIHYSKKRTITGCVASGASGMSLTDEKDKQIYQLSGDTTGVKAGDRMTLQGKKMKSTGSDKTLVWEAKTVTKDFGVCTP